MRTIKPVISCYGALFFAWATSTWAQGPIEIETTSVGAISTTIESNLQAGAVPGIVFGQPPSPGLLIRTERPVLCAGVGYQGSNSTKKVVFDLKGYFEPVPLSMMAVEEKLGTLFYGENAFIRAAEPIRFNTGAYVFVENNLLFDVDGVSGYCILGLTVDTPPMQAACDTAKNEDPIFSDGYQLLPQGSLQLTATSQQVGVNINYEYVLRAVNGPVYDIQLREQFPYFEIGGSSLPIFKKSMALQENWSCEASLGGICDSRGRWLDGAGYIHLDGGRLASGACLKVNTSRYLRTDGVEAQHPFSGRIHAAAIYSTAPTTQGPSTRKHTVLRHLFLQ